MFCRSGGVSSGPFASLNLSFHVGDHPDNVRCNRSRVLESLGLGRLISVHQVHGDRILVADHRHLNTEWTVVEARLNASLAKLGALAAMEQTGSEPDVVDDGQANDAMLFMDCSKETPKDRQSLCYDLEAQTKRLRQQCP
jgi:hypothetical protein